MVSTGNASEIRDLLEIIGGKKPEYLKMWLYRIATAAGLSLRVVEDAFQGQYVSKKTVWQLKLTAEKIRNAHDNTAARLESIAAQLETIDPDFHRGHVDLLLSVAAQYRREDKGAK